MLSNFRSYQLALELYNQCDQIKAKTFLKDQLERASLSVVLNLAEGSAKPTAKDRARFYAIAYASLREVQSLLQILKQNEVFKSADELGGMIYKLSRK